MNESDSAPNKDNSNSGELSSSSENSPTADINVKGAKPSHSRPDSGSGLLHLGQMANRSSRGDVLGSGSGKKWCSYVVVVVF